MYLQTQFQFSFDPKPIHVQYTYTVMTSRQRPCNILVCCRLCSMAKLYDIGDGPLDNHKCVIWSLVVVRKAIKLKYRNTPIDTCRYIKLVKCIHNFKRHVKGISRV